MYFNAFSSVSNWRRSDFLTFLTIYTSRQRTVVQFEFKSPLFVNPVPEPFTFFLDPDDYPDFQVHPVIERFQQVVMQVEIYLCIEVITAVGQLAGGVFHRYLLCRAYTGGKQ